MTERKQTTTTRTTRRTTSSKAQGEKTTGTRKATASKAAAPDEAAKAKAATTPAKTTRTAAAKATKAASSKPAAKKAVKNADEKAATTTSAKTTPAKTNEPETVKATAKTNEPDSAKATTKKAAPKTTRTTTRKTAEKAPAKAAAQAEKAPAKATTPAKKTAGARKKLAAKAKAAAAKDAANKTAQALAEEIAKEVPAETPQKAEPKAEPSAQRASAPTAEPVVAEAPEPAAEPTVNMEAAEGQESAAAEQASEAAVEETPVEQAEPPAPEYADVPGVLIAAAECAPLVKVGGLADVVGALPKYLKKLGVDARIIMPFHRQIKERYFTQVQHLCDFQASLGWRSQYVGVEKLELDGTVFYFIDNEFYFGGPVYCGGEFEGEQYAFFTRAVMDAIPQLDFDVRILHCNDWHTAMMPLLARTQYQGGMQASLRTVLTIHNLHFQGQFSHEFDRDLLGVDDSLATPQFVEHYGCDNMLKAGIVFADKVTTVSPTYSQEICGPELGESLEGVLRSRGGDLWGILNGIDVDTWNPQTDPVLPARYTAESLHHKSEDRDALLEELGLEPAGENTAVIAMVGRLTPQKGIDLVKCVLDDILYDDVRMIVLGSGDEEYENFLRDAEYRHKGRLCSYIGYNGDLSHRIYAGSDLFLMPSLFEPCGISQMIAMRYGTLPIVRETGGLKDTVTPYNEFTGEGNGFSFANYNAHEMLGVIRWALSVWRNKDVRERLITQAMESDFSFDRCARTYAELYRTL